MWDDYTFVVCPYFLDLKFCGSFDKVDMYFKTLDNRFLMI